MPTSIASDSAVSGFVAPISRVWIASASRQKGSARDSRGEYHRE
jgi:hypothetical protein